MCWRSRWIPPSAPDIPPFGYQIDYLTFGGIYREVSLRIVPATFIENIFAQPKDVLCRHPSLDVQCFLQPLRSRRKNALALEAALRDGDARRGQDRAASSAVGRAPEPVSHTLHLENLGAIELWDLREPESLLRRRAPPARRPAARQRHAHASASARRNSRDHGFELNGNGH